MKEVIYLESVFHLLFCKHFELLIKDFNYLFCNEKRNFPYLIIINFNSLIVLYIFENIIYRFRIYISFYS